MYPCGTQPDQFMGEGITLASLSNILVSCQDQNTPWKEYSIEHVCLLFTRFWHRTHQRELLQFAVVFFLRKMSFIFVFIEFIYCPSCNKMTLGSYCLTVYQTLSHRANPVCSSSFSGFREREICFITVSRVFFLLMFDLNLELPICRPSMNSCPFLCDPLPWPWQRKK